MSETNIESLCVYRNGHHLFVGDDETSIVVASQALKTQPDPDHGYRVFRQCDSMLHPRDGMRRANAGLLPVLRLLARRDGRDLIELCESHFLPLPEPVDDPRIIDTTLAPFLGSRERGVIRVGPSVCIAQIIAQVAAAYPTCRIAILGSHKAQLYSAYKKLKNWLSTHDIRREVPPDDSGAWVAFSTFTAAAAGDLEKCHLVILLDATHAAHQRAEPALAAMDAQFRLFGVLREDRRLSPTERDVLMATFGPAVLDMPRHGGELAEVSLAWRKWPICACTATRGNVLWTGTPPSNRT
jgi:hypothetical protein